MATVVDISAPGKNDNIHHKREITLNGLLGHSFPCSKANILEIVLNISEFSVINNILTKVT